MQRSDWIEVLNWVKRQGAELREQRRYEIARDVVAGLMSDPSFNPTDIRDTSIWCIEVADALLAELERTDGE